MTTPTTTLAEIQAFGSRSFRLCGLTYEFLFNTFKDRIQAGTTFANDAPESVKVRLSTLSGYYSRVVGWMGTVVKLNAAQDLQAVAVALRASFEAAVDLALLHGMEKENFQKMFDWERSAKVRYAQGVVTFFQGRPPPHHAAMFGPLRSDEPDDLSAARKRWYGKDIHPRRWTGEELDADAKRADDAMSRLGVPTDPSLLEFYVTQYSPLCWATHGSGMAALRSPSEAMVQTQCAIWLSEVHGFARLVVQLLLMELGLYLAVEFSDFLACPEVAELVAQQ